MKVKTKIFKTFLLAGILLFSSIHIANAIILDFDDISLKKGTSVEISDSYNEFNWENIYITNHGLQGDGDKNGTVSGNNVAYNYGGNEASISSKEKFNFKGASFTSAKFKDVYIEINGYSEGKLMYTWVKSDLNSKEPLNFVVNFDNIDKLTFKSTDKHGSEIFVMDNFAYDFPTPAPTPESSSIILGFLGLGGLLGLRKKSV